MVGGRPDAPRGGLTRPRLCQVWPHAFVLAGFGFVESAMLVTAAINAHHFIVDAYI